MRLVLFTLFVVLLAPAALADPPVSMEVDHVRESAGTPRHVSIHNNSDTEDALNAVVEITLGPGLDFFGTPFGDARDVTWSCLRNGSKATCRAERILAATTAVIVFTPTAADREGGYRPADVTFTAQNATRQTLAMQVVTARILIVNTAADFGAGSLRAALEDVNASPLCGTDVPCIIGFTDLAVLTIAPATPLPVIRKCNLDIRGPDDPESPRSNKRVVISGENASHGNGLEISCDAPGHVSISGLVVHSWPWNGIAIYGSERASHSIAQTYIGTDYTGLAARPNGARGMVLDAPNARLFLLHDVISANGRSGVALFRGEQAQIETVKIGVGRDDAPMGNGASGLFTFNVPFSVAGSTIAHNAHAGVAVARGTAKAGIAGNAIYSNGGLPIDWGLDDRTLPDRDESDGVPNTPRIADVFYDAAENQTIVRGTVRLRGPAGQTYTVHALLASSPRGDLPTRRVLWHQAAVALEHAADVPFEIEVHGDFRGQLIAVQLHGPGVSSEISEAMTVR